MIYRKPCVGARNEDVRNTWCVVSSCVGGESAELSIWITQLLIVLITKQCEMWNVFLRPRQNNTVNVLQSSWTGAMPATGVNVLRGRSLSFHAWLTLVLLYYCLLCSSGCGDYHSNHTNCTKITQRKLRPSIISPSSCCCCLLSDGSWWCWALNIFMVLFICHLILSKAPRVKKIFTTPGH